MTDKKITDLPNAATIALTDLLEAVVGGTSSKVLVSVIRAALMPIVNADVTSVALGKITGFAANIATFLTTPSGANLASALTSALPVSKGGTGLTSLTIPASALLVGTTDTQALTGKTMVLASNTVTDTSAALGDIAKHDGTRFVRLARGSANQVLSVNGAGTDIAWATLGGGSLGTNVTSGNTFIGIALAAGTLATAGDLRFATGAQTHMAQRNIAGTADLSLCAMDGSDVMYIGGDSGFTAANTVQQMNLEANGLIQCWVGGAAQLYMDGTLIQCRRPQVGYSAANSVWGAVDGMSQTVVSTTGITLTAAEYSRKTQKFTGAPAAARTITYPLPTSDDEAYTRVCWCQTTVSGLTITNTGGSTVALTASSAPATILFTTTGAVRLV